MGHDDRREIFERLEALERQMGSRRENHRSWGDDRRGGRDHHAHGRDRHGGDFQEKRIIDTIVRLVTERVGRIVQDQQAKARRQDGGQDEKRIVDLIVRLVSEHVKEIVSAELDRRFGRPPVGEGQSPPALGGGESSKAEES
jgi:hypothetical protein